MKGNHMVYVIYESEKGTKLSECSGNGEIKLDKLLYSDPCSLRIYTDAGEAIKYLCKCLDLEQESVCIQNEEIQRLQDKINHRGKRKKS